MNRLYPYVTGLDGQRYKCQLRRKYEEGGAFVYAFLVESTGTTYLIKKADDKWDFIDNNDHLDHWVDELGTYVDESGV